MALAARQTVVKSTGPLVPAVQAASFATAELTDLAELACLRTSWPVEADQEGRGTRSIGRVIRLMRVVASRPQFGWRLSDLSAASGLDRATVHRMLACMVEERLVIQRSSDRHYMPGPLMYELGLALPDHVQFQRCAEPVVEAFARRMAGIGVLLLRSGNEYVCSIRMGTRPLSGSVLYPGTRRPLFTAAGGVAILQNLSADESTEVLRDNVAQEVARCGTGRLSALQQMRKRSALHGFGVNLGDVVPGIHAFGVPVQGVKGHVFASLCLLGTPEMYGEDRIDELRSELFTTAVALTVEARKFRV